MSGLTTTEQALRLFAQDNPNCLNLLAEFCGVQDLAVRRWIRGENQPKGEEQLCLRVFLTHAGYHLREFQPLSTDSQSLGQLIAHRVISAEEVKAELGYKEMKGVFDVVLRGSALQPDRRYRLERLVERLHHELLPREDRLTQNINTLRGEDPDSGRAGSIAELHNQVENAFGPDPVLSLVNVTDKAFGGVRAEARPQPDAYVINPQSHDHHLVPPTVKLIGTLLDLTNAIDQSPNAHGLRFVIGTVSAYDISQLRIWFDSLETR